MIALKSTLPNATMQQITGYEEIQGLLYVAVATIRRVDFEYRSRPGDLYNFQLFDIADWTCLPVYVILYSFLDAIEPGNVPICKAGYFGKLNLGEDLLTPEEKFTQDKIVLLERFIPEIIFLANMHDKGTGLSLELPGEDELTKGIRKLVSAKQIPIWLVLALQIQLDIHYMLLADTSRAHNELFNAGIRTVVILTKYLDFSRDMQIVGWPKKNNEWLEHIISECQQSITSDFLGPARSLAYKQLGEDKGGNFTLFKRHPILCGMMLFRLNLVMQDLGINVASACKYSYSCSTFTSFRRQMSSKFSDIEE